MTAVMAEGPILKVQKGRLKRLHRTVFKVFFEGLVSLSDEHDDQGGEHLRADFERREPRCRICRDETVRMLVNELLDWHGVPIRLGRGKTHVITYVDILRDLEPLNEGRDERDRITYDSPDWRTCAEPAAVRQRVPMHISAVFHLPYQCAVDLGSAYSGYSTRQ